MKASGEQIGILKFILYVAVLLLSMGASYGALNSRIETLEEKALKQQSAHELIVILNSKIDRLFLDLKEIKTDLKDLKDR